MIRVRTDLKPILVAVNTKLPPAESRVNWEEGAYLVVDLHYNPPVRATKWKRLRADQAVVIDFAPTGPPVLFEVRQPWETWEQIQSLPVPVVGMVGSARILTGGRVSLPLTVSCDPDRTLAYIGFGDERPDQVVRVASGLAIELARIVFESPDALTGHLVGLWVLDLPKIPASAALFRALRVVGPPIGGIATRDPWETKTFDPEPDTLKPKRSH